MAKTQEELQAFKTDVEDLSKKLAELSEEELKIVTGGGLFGPATWMWCSSCGYVTLWKGICFGTYECPNCNEMSFSATDYDY